MFGNMEQNPCVQSIVDPSSSQFRQQLNQWFEQHGVLDNLRSHLRSVMITALQQKEFRLRPHQKTTPKVQSANLLVAEYLLKQGCHYTLSILMSELPALANFASGAILFHCGPKIEERNKSKEIYRFEDNEVIEILNSLGMSAQDEFLNLICDYYGRKRDEESLLECLLRFVGKTQSETKHITRCPGNAGSGELAGPVSDPSKGIRENPSRRISPRQFLSIMSEGDFKKAVEEENDRRMMELIDREKRIQNYLKSHEEEVLERLRLAEKELNSRRETIDRELSERQLHLGRLAIQLKDKYSEIMELSRNLATVKSDNIILRSKLDSVQVELNELREELEKKSEIIERLEAERMSMKCHVQEYLKWKNTGGTDGEVVTSTLHIGVRRKTFETKENRIMKLEMKNKENCSSSQGDSPSSDESSGEEAILKKVKARVELLDHENSQISEKYLKYKKKYENQLEDSEYEELNATVLDAQPEEPLRFVDAAVEPVKPAEPEVTPDICQEDKKEIAETPPLILYDSTESRLVKKTTVEEEKRMTVIPTKRQQKNLELFHESRNLLEALEKSAGFIDGNESIDSTSNLSLCCSWSSKPEEDGNEISEKSKSRRNESGFRDLSDLECLTLLKEATRPVRKEEVEAPVSRDEGG